MTRFDIHSIRPNGVRVYAASHRPECYAQWGQWIDWVASIGPAKLLDWYKHVAPMTFPGSYGDSGYDDITCLAYAIREYGLQNARDRFAARAAEHGDSHYHACATVLGRWLHA